MTAPAELTAFVHREHPRLVRAVHLLLDDHAVAEEIAQEALLRAAGRWEQLATMNSPGGWTHRVAINLATSQLRRRRIERRARSRMASEERISAPDTATAMTVRAALRSLPDPHRRVLVLRHVLDWTTTEIAELDGVRPDAIRQRLHRARAALRDQLGPDVMTGLVSDDLDARSVTTGLPCTTTDLSLDVEETTDAH